MPQEEINRRSFDRFDLHEPIRFQVRGRGNFDNAVCENLGEGGLGFSSPHYIRAGTNLMLEINLLSRILNLVGRVAWCTPVAHSDNNRVGVEFIEIDQRQRNYLKDFLSLRKDIV